MDRSTLKQLYCKKHESDIVAMGFSTNFQENFLKCKVCIEEEEKGEKKYIFLIHHYGKQSNNSQILLKWVSYEELNKLVEKIQQNLNSNSVNDFINSLQTKFSRILYSLQCREKDQIDSIRKSFLNDYLQATKQEEYLSIINSELSQDQKEFQIKKVFSEFLKLMDENMSKIRHLVEKFDFKFSFKKALESGMLIGDFLSEIKLFEDSNQIRIKEEKKLNVDQILSLINNPFNSVPSKVLQELEEQFYKIVDFFPISVKINPNISKKPFHQLNKTEISYFEDLIEKYLQQKEIQQEINSPSITKQIRDIHQQIAFNEIILKSANKTKVSLTQKLNSMQISINNVFYLHSNINILFSEKM